MSLKSDFLGQRNIEENLYDNRTNLTGRDNFSNTLVMYRDSASMNQSSLRASTRDFGKNSRGCNIQTAKEDQQSTKEKPPATIFGDSP